MNFNKCTVCGSPWTVLDVFRWGASVEIITGCSKCTLKESTIKKIKEKRKEKIYFENGKIKVNI